MTSEVSWPFGVTFELRGCAFQIRATHRIVHVKVTPCYQNYVVVERGKGNLADDELLHLIVAVHEGYAPLLLVVPDHDCEFATISLFGHRD